MNYLMIYPKSRILLSQSYATHSSLQIEKFHPAQKLIFMKII